MSLSNGDLLLDYVRRPENRVRLLKVASRLLPDEAEDALHDGILQALSSRAGFRGDARVSTWMHRVVVNAALMRRRSGGRKRRLETTARQTSTTTWLTGEGTSPPAEEHLERAAREAHVRAALDALPPLYRDVARLCLLDEQPPREVAARLGMALPAVRSRAQRARKMLAASLAA